MWLIPTGSIPAVGEELHVWKNDLIQRQADEVGDMGSHPAW